MNAFSGPAKTRAAALATSKRPPCRSVVGEGHRGAGDRLARVAARRSARSSASRRSSRRTRSISSCVARARRRKIAPDTRRALSPPRDRWRPPLAGLSARLLAPCWPSLAQPTKGTVLSRLRGERGEEGSGDERRALRRTKLQHGASPSNRAIIGDRRGGGKRRSRVGAKPARCCGARWSGRRRLRGLRLDIGDHADDVLGDEPPIGPRIDGVPSFRRG